MSLLCVASNCNNMHLPVCDRFIVDQILFKVAFGSRTYTCIENNCKLASSCNQEAGAEAETFHFMVVATKHASDCACSTLLEMRSGGRYSTYMVKLFLHCKELKLEVQHASILDSIIAADPEPLAQQAGCGILL